MPQRILTCLMNRIPTLVAAPAAPATPAFEAATPALEAAAPALEAVTPAVAVKGARRLMTCHCLAKAFPCSTYSRLINLRPLQLNSAPPSLSLSLSLSLPPSSVSMWGLSRLIHSSYALLLFLFIIRFNGAAAEGANRTRLPLAIRWNPSCNPA